MGVKGLSTPVIQDSVTVKNAYIKKLLEKDATNNIIGIDIMFAYCQGNHGIAKLSILSISSF